MSPLHGYRTPWNEYPDWLGRYDFAVKVSPYSGPGWTHVERVGNGPLSRVVRYQGPPVGGVLSRLWRAIRPGPVFFTSFLYDDGGEHEVPRAAVYFRDARSGAVPFRESLITPTYNYGSERG